MRDLTGKHVQSLQGSSRHIVVRGDEALILEKYKNQLSVHICALDAESIIRHFYTFDGAYQDELQRFLSDVERSKVLVPGIRIGPLFKNGHIRRIVMLQNKKKTDATFFFKTIPFTEKDRGWKYNRSGWVPVTQLGSQVSGMIVFIREIMLEDLLEITEAYTAEGVYFLHDKHEVYVESVMRTYAFGKLIPRGIGWASHKKDV